VVFDIALSPDRYYISFLAPTAQKDTHKGFQYIAWGDGLLYKGFNPCQDSHNITPLYNTLSVEFSGHQQE
jgi:hypothetical protein